MHLSFHPVGRGALLEELQPTLVLINPPRGTTVIYQWFNNSGVYGSVPLWNSCAVQEEHQCIHSPYTNKSSVELMCFNMNVAQYIYNGRFNVGSYINS